MAKPGCESAPAASLAHVLLLPKRDDSMQLQLCHSSSSSSVAVRVKTPENTSSERWNSFIGMSKDATVLGDTAYHHFLAHPALAFVHDFSHH